MKDLKKILGLNEAARAKKLAKDPAFFQNLAKGQSPKYLWIGCSDSRILPHKILGLQEGEIFIHRNVANLAPKDDVNFLSFLDYGVEFLKVEHIFICGHYGCGGMLAAVKGLLGNDNLDKWLDSTRRLYEKNKEILYSIKSEIEKSNKLAIINVKEQLKNICSSASVQEAWQQGRAISIHGLIYDLETGLLKDLKISCSNNNDFQKLD